MTLIGSIDVAIKNLGFSVVDSCTKKIVYIEKASILNTSSGTLIYKEDMIVDIVNQFIKDRIQIFSNLEMLVIEKQMTSKMKLIAMAFHGLLYSKIRFIVHLAPILIKKYFNISMKNYNMNKKAAVNKMVELASDDVLSKVSKYKKKDDVSDAFLQCLYAMENYDSIIKKINK
jgi:Holliday junction resolvasome RuvABC endonuclease subunit